MNLRSEVNEPDQSGRHFASLSQGLLGLHCCTLNRHSAIDHSSRKGAPCSAVAFHWEIAIIGFTQVGAAGGGGECVMLLTNFEFGRLLVVKTGSQSHHFEKSR